MYVQIGQDSSSSRTRHYPSTKSIANTACPDPWLNHVWSFRSCRLLLWYFPSNPMVDLSSSDISTGRKPTSATSEAKVSIAPGSMPWQTESSQGDDAREHFKYQYHPGGDPRNPPKDAPSAMHSVIVPNVNLPKVRDITQSRMLDRWMGSGEVEGGKSSFRDEFRRAGA
jgi:hypothetical protein